MKMKQIDIFGNETDLNTINKKPKSIRLTIKDRFRQFHGYYKDYKCKDCIYCIQLGNRGRRYYKCVKIGITSSNATDIHLKDYSCNLFSIKEEKQ